MQAIDLLIHFFARLYALQGAKKRTKKMTPVAFAVLSSHTAAPLDFLALLKAAMILRTREVYTPFRGTQTVQNPLWLLFQCSANANGKTI